MWCSIELLSNCCRFRYRGRQNRRRLVLNVDIFERCQNSAFLVDPTHGRIQPESMSAHLSLDSVGICIFINQTIFSSLTFMSLKQFCYPPPWDIIVSCTVCGILTAFTLVFVIAYRYRWSLRLRSYYLSKAMRRNCCRRAEYDHIGEQTEYDLMVSYFEDDASGEWVRNMLVPTLTGADRVRLRHDGNGERSGGNGGGMCWQGLEELSVFYDEGNILYNQNVIGAIVDAMVNSRKVTNE